MIEQRECRRFWHSSGGEIHRVLGFSCRSALGPDTPYWWVPSRGESCAEGYTLFAHLDDAVKHAVAALKIERARLDQKCLALVHWL